MFSFGERPEMNLQTLKHVGLVQLSFAFARLGVRSDGTFSQVPGGLGFPAVFCGTGHSSFFRAAWAHSPLKFHTVALDNGLWFYETWRYLVVFFAPGTLEFVASQGIFCSLQQAVLMVLINKVRITLFKSNSPNWRHLYELSAFKAICSSFLLQAFN